MVDSVLCVQHDGWVYSAMGVYMVDGVYMLLRI